LTPPFCARDDSGENLGEQRSETVVKHHRPRFEVGLLLDDLKGGIMGGLLSGFGSGVTSLLGSVTSLVSVVTSLLGGIL
jgi:hypothetical protein